MFNQDVAAVSTSSHGRTSSYSLETHGLEPAISLLECRHLFTPLRVSIPTIDATTIDATVSATIDATVAATHPDRAVWSYASSAVYATCTDNGVSLRHEGNQYAEERRGGCGSGDYLTNHVRS
jgi:hypothetical protein